MGESLAVRAEILKLARLLRREPADLDYLTDVPAADIRALREGVTDVLFTAHGQVLARLPTGEAAAMGAHQVASGDLNPLHQPAAAPTSQRQGHRNQQQHNRSPPQRGVHGEQR